MNKFRGMLMGVAIGDYLGSPFESKSQEKILEMTGGEVIDKYRPECRITDDTQLTMALIEGMLESYQKYDNPFSMQCQADAHVNAFKESIHGWGGSTRESVRKIINGCSWENAGKVGGKITGLGNGIAMKIAPVSLYLMNKFGNTNAFRDGLEFIANLCRMTHQTQIAAFSGYTQFAANLYCLRAKKFDAGKFVRFIQKFDWLGENFFKETASQDDFRARVELLKQHKEYDTQRIIQEFGAGSCYCYNSLPFTYMFFVKDPTIKSLYTVCAAGGDVDTNASMIGGFLGGLYGEEVFPQYLIDELPIKDKIYELTERFQGIL